MHTFPMDRKAMMCIASAAVLAVCACSLIVFSGSSDDPGDSGDAAEPSSYKHEDFGMMILAGGDAGDPSSAFAESYTVSGAVAADEIPAGAAVIVDGMWFGSVGGDAAGDFLTQLYERGNVIAAFADIGTFTGAVPFGFVAYSDTANLYAAYHDPDTGRNVFCSICAGSDESSIAKFREWAAEYAAEGSEPDSSILKAAGVTDGSGWGGENYSCLYRECSGCGWMEVGTCYYTVKEDNDSYSYYCTRYDVQGVPDGCSVSDLNISTELGDGYSILQYGPSTMKGSDVSVSLGSISDGSASRTVSWDYQADISVIKDRSNYATGEIRIDHELDNGDARNACAVMPGKVVRVECGPGNTDGSYSATDHYEVAFCRNTGSGLFGMSEECQLFSEDIRVLIR